MTRLNVLFRACAVLGLVVATHCNATEPSWAEEPRAVFGIELGKPLDPTLVPPCPVVDYSNPRPHARQTSLCQQPADPFSGISILGTPDIGFFHSTVITLFDGKVMQIAFNFQNFQFEQAVAVLTARYGKARNVKTGAFKTRAGGDHTSRTLSWTGNETLLVAMERNTHLDVGQIAFIDLRLYAEYQKAVESSAKRGASRL